MNWNWKAILNNYLTYGKGPTIRGAIWLLTFLAGRYGWDAAQAGQVGQAAGAELFAAISGFIALATSTASSKNLAENPPPSPVLDVKPKEEAKPKTPDVFKSDGEF